MGRGRPGSGAQLKEECVQLAAFQMVASWPGGGGGRNLSTRSMGRGCPSPRNYEGWIFRGHLLDRPALLADGASVRTLPLVLPDASSGDGHVCLHPAELRDQLSGRRRSGV